MLQMSVERTLYLYHDRHVSTRRYCLLRVRPRRSTDMATMENLWLKYSKGRFGYSVQKELWRKTKGDFENFCRRIGWTTQDSEVNFGLRCALQYSTGTVTVASNKTYVFFPVLKVCTLCPNICPLETQVKMVN